MEPWEEKLLFVDRFKPGLKGIEILVLQHLILDYLDRHGLSSNLVSILEDIRFNLDDIVSKHKVPSPPDCFSIF